MADKEKKKIKRYTTPLGEAKFPKLVEPDTKFKDAGEYSVKLLLDPEDAQPLIAMIEEAEAEAEEAAKEARKGMKGKKAQFEMKNRPFEEDEDKDGEPTGKIAFKFSMTASGKDKKTGREWTNRPALFDAKGKPIDPKTIRIWGGSKLKVAFFLTDYDTSAAGVGVALKLNAVQVIELNDGARSAEDYGFGEEEGYEYAEQAAGFDGSGEETAGGEGDDAEGDF